MTTQQTESSTIFTTVHPDIVKRTSISSLIYSATMIVVGFGVFLSAFELQDPSSTLSMTLMVIGTIFMLFGIFRLFWKSKEMVYLPTGSSAKESTFFFDTQVMNTLAESINSGKFAMDKPLKMLDSGNVRLDIVMSQDMKFAAAQLFQFVPYTYNPVTEVRYFTEEQAKSMADYLKVCKNN
ncbi:MAG: hypothetical protein RR220_02085 [Bacteroidaceae bacterium]